jgi:peptidoglycan hydrolase-like protein with peptidoglycan-binding domain
MPPSKLEAGDFGKEVADVQKALANHGIEVSPEERQRQFFGPSTRAAVARFQAARGLPETSEVNEATATSLASAATSDSIAVHGEPAANRATASRDVTERERIFEPIGVAEGPPSDSGRGGERTAGDAARVAGTIALEHGPPASQLTLRLYQRGFGETRTILGEVHTNQQGGYEIPYNVDGAANIELFAVAADGSEVQLSQTRFAAKLDEQIDLIAPSDLQPAASEFARLQSAVAPHLGNEPNALVDAVERGDRRDFTFLQSATGWDAGALALASEAFDGEARTKIPADGLYALARAGLPSDVRLLANASDTAIEIILRQAAATGIVDADKIDPTTRAFREFAREYKFANAILGASSSPQDFIEKARLSDADRTAFTSVARDDASADVWKRAQAAGVSEAGIQHLQLQGKLAYLTFNNVELVDYLSTKVTDPRELIDLGYYDDAKWTEALQELAGTDPAALESLIPPTFSANTVDERMQGYAAELARRVRQMDPHAVTVDRITAGKIEGVSSPTEVGKFLKNAAPLGFRLGATPFGSFAVRNQEAIWAGIPVEMHDEVQSSVRSLSSLYAMTPTDDALSAVLRAGFTSATAIARHDYATFFDRVKPFLPGPAAGDQQVTQQVFWKAQQQSATVFNLFDGLKRLNTVSYAPGSTPEDMKQRDDQVAKTRAKLAGMFPTLETLFGSVDFCECNECQSVLSPAAYLVDILHFLDPNEEAWATVRASYETRMGVAYAKQKPFDVLNNRRPDLKNIALTCENTNTALPYVDVVLEVLEQVMMSDQSPPEIEAYDVGESLSADLIAEPHNILWSAYVGTPGKPGLRDLVFPIALPFDLPLETARSFMRQLDLPLWRLRQYMNRPVALDPSAVGRTDGWTDVWFERLGLGRSDVSTVTRSDDWYELFGYETESDALKMETDATGTRPAETSLRNAKTLARRLDMTYEELVELIRCRLINPNIENLITLQRLGVDPATLDRYLGTGTPLSDAERTELEADILAQKVSPADLAPLRASAIRQSTVVLRAPSVGCDFAETTLEFEEDPPDADEAIAFVLRKMNGFVRLQKRLGWDIHELDRILVAVLPGGAEVAATTWAEAMKTALIYLAHVEDLRERLQNELSREEIVVLWSDIPTVGVSCLYERLFVSPGALGRDIAFDKRLGSVVEDNTVMLRSHIDSVRQALSLTHDDIEAILQAAGTPDPTLSIDSLSVLMRHRVLAEGLGLSITDLLSLMSLSDRKPLSPLDPSPLTDLANDVPWNETLAFVEEVELGIEAGADPAFFDRVCWGRSQDDPQGPDADPALLAVTGLPPADSADPADQSKHQNLIVQTLAAQLLAPGTVVDRLLGTALKDQTNKPMKETDFSDQASATAVLSKLRAALELIQSLGITDGELSYLMALPDAVDLNALPVEEVTVDETARAIKRGLLPWLMLAAVRRQFGRSERLLAVLAAASPHPVDATDTADLLESRLIAAMGALTRVKPSVLSASLAALGATSAGGQLFEIPALAHPATLRRTIESLKCVVRLGLDPKDVVRITGSTIDEVIAGELRSSLKGRFAASAWRRLATPIFDGLRRKQRDALVAHLTHVMDGDVPKFGETPEKLFEYLLLDPEMEPVVLASRIQLAIASVQLFVQRCLMNLEAGVDPQIIDTQRWDWMRRYRVWEVNRKMFIWPENWLDPEFRDDRTHLFRDLEGKLLQGDVDEDLVRTSMYSYVKGLEEIARLQMLTMYYEPGASADATIVHVVGRTPNAPHKYFYRSASHGMWTPWEPLDVGIEGEHLVLTSWRGRLHLFWVSFLEQTDKNPNMPESFTPVKDTVATGSLRGVSQVKLQLHWVEQVKGKWVNRASTPSFSPTAFAGLKATTDDEKRAFFVRAVVVENAAGPQDDDLEIQITQGDKAHSFVLFSKLAAPRSLQQGSAPAAPPFGMSSSATKWWRGDSLSVEFVSAVTESSMTGTSSSGGGPHKVLTGAPGFTLLFPSNESLPLPAQIPPSGVGRPSGYVFSPQDATHIAYRSGDGSIHDLYSTGTGWFYQSPSSDAEASGSADNYEPANSDPHGYGADDLGSICIAYSGATKIHELVWSQLDTALDDPDQLGTGWHIETLYVGATAADDPQGRPFGGVFLPDRGVAFRTSDGRVRAVVAPGGGPWEIRDLNTSLPAAASEPTGVVMTHTELGVTTISSRHLFYVGVDGDVHELRSDASATSWVHTNITQGLANAVRPATGSTPAAYAFLAQNTVHVVYRGADNQIHELWGNPGSWNYNAIGAGFTKAKGDPAGYVTESFLTQHVVYRGAEDQVVELWWSDRWRENVLTTSTASAPTSGSDIAGYSFESNRTQHVAYFADDGTPRELRWNVVGWAAGAYELSNPFPDDLGPLAAPFFYEAASKDHTFFVEPFVIETAVHDWTAWIVTTKTYVVDIPFDRRIFTPLHPDAIELVPSDVGILKNVPDRFKTKVFGADVIIRTSKGTIQPEFGGVAKEKVETLGVARLGSSFVDTFKGQARADFALASEKRLVEGP